MDKVAAEFIKPNDRLTSFERLQLYNRMYWFRLLDAIRDDCPGLLAALGERAFSRLAQAYLERRPSRSFTLRDLCSRLERFIRRQSAAHGARGPRWLPRSRGSSGRRRSPLTASRGRSSRHRASRRTPPSRLRLGLQPYVTLLALRYPIDTYVIAVKRRDALRSEASNTPDARPRSTGRSGSVARPRPRRTFVAVHRHHNRLYLQAARPCGVPDPRGAGPGPDALPGDRRRRPRGQAGAGEGLVHDLDGAGLVLRATGIKGAGTHLERTGGLASPAARFNLPKHA